MAQGIDQRVTRTSNRFTFVTLGLIGLMILEAFCGLVGTANLAVAWYEQLLVVAVAVWSVVYFTIVVIIPMFWVWGRSFDIKAHTLLLHIIISALYAICAFALIYRVLGVRPVPDHPVRDGVYFSMVTFSTLGFGDITPDPRTRIWAGLQGIWGNVHLGLLAGAAFFALDQGRKQKGPSPGEEPSDPAQLGGPHSGSDEAIGGHSDGEPHDEGHHRE